MVNYTNFNIYLFIIILYNSLKTKITTKVYNFIIIHSYKTLECELCKKVLPEKIKLKNEIINLLDLQKPENNYLMLESIIGGGNYDNTNINSNELKYIYIIHMKNKTSIRLGRANDADVRITDISVSRYHALLKLINGAFYLEDTNSKFGSLIQIPNKISVLPNKQLTLQNGRFLIKLNMKKTFCAILSCYK
jgi:hypothetical protein